MEAIDFHHHRNKTFSPTRRIGFSFLMVIVIGAYLLSLPISNKGNPLPFLDHLFISTSATCVTGLVSCVVKEQYSLFGQIVILCLIQIGGLGFLTLLNVTFVFLKKKLTYTNKIIMQEALNQSSLSELDLYIKRVIKYTFFFETLGALLLMIRFIPMYGYFKGIYYGVFHSVSAFCNAGFDVLGSSSLISFQKDVFVNFVICFLIVAGGLGFVVWIDLRTSFKRYKEHFKYFKIKRYLSSLSLHTKIVLISTGVLLLSGAIIVLLLEWDNPNTLGPLDWPYKLLASFFQSTTLRTAGFATVDMAQLYDSTKLIMSCFMFIGGSPAGTAGGIKTVTFVLLIFYIISLAKGSDRIQIMKRSFSEQTVKRAMSISLVSYFIVLFGLVLLSLTEKQSFINLLFEAFSAFATVGLTAGLTPYLSAFGKMIVIVLMYIGRIGPITMVLIFVRKYTQKKGKDILYPQDDVLIG